MLGKPLIQSGVCERIWRLKDTEPERFKQEVKDYFVLAYPMFTVVNAKYPIIWLQG